jgi:hypothetical protein
MCSSLGLLACWHQYKHSLLLLLLLLLLLVLYNVIYVNCDCILFSLTTVSSNLLKCIMLSCLYKI